MPHVVVGDHRLGQHEPDVGEAELVGVGVGDALDEAHPVPGDRADGAAREARERRAGGERRAQRREALAQPAQRIARRCGSAARRRPRASTASPSRASNTARAPLPMKLQRAHFSPPCTDSNRNEVRPSSRRRNSESGVSRSAAISRTRGTTLPRSASFANSSWLGRSTGGLGGSEFLFFVAIATVAAAAGLERPDRVFPEADQAVAEGELDPARPLVRDLRPDRPAPALRDVLDARLRCRGRTTPRRSTASGRSAPSSA